MSEKEMQSRDHTHYDKVPIANRASCKSGQFSFSLLCVSQKLKFLEVLDLIRTAQGKIEIRNFDEADPTSNVQKNSNSSVHLSQIT